MNAGATRRTSPRNLQRPKQPPQTLPGTPKGNPAKERMNSSEIQEITDQTLPIGPILAPDDVLACSPVPVELFQSPQPQTNPTTPRPRRSPRRRDFSAFQANLEKFDEGYDNDGQIGPFLDAIEKEGPQLFEEAEANPIPTENPAPVTAAAPTAAVAAAVNPHKEGTNAWFKFESDLRIMKSKQGTRGRRL